ncbi:MAG TPA: hypothetical protein VEA38_11250 [Terriglobales bacterium]|nr:hypothetical protein [Terriglobales bacterium]
MISEVILGLQGAIRKLDNPELLEMADGPHAATVRKIIEARRDLCRLEKLVWRMHQVYQEAVVEYATARLDDDARDAQLRLARSGEGCAK